MSSPKIATVNRLKPAESEELFRTAFYGSPVASVISITSTGEMIEVNDAYCRLVGYPRWELIGRTTLELGIWARTEDRRGIVDRFTRDGHVRDAEIAIRTRSGEIRHVVGSFEPISIGGMSAMISTSIDITERKLVEQAVAENENRFRHVTMMTSDLFYSCRRTEEGIFRVEWLGGNAESLFGISNEELKELGCWRDFVLTEDLPLFDQNITALVPGQTGNAILRVLHRDGTVRHVQSFAHVGSDPDDKQPDRLYGALQDITERVALERRLEHLADTDFLTGFANRRRFLELAEKELVRVRRYHSPLSIAMLDLDHFKDVNDTYGHEVGDKVLREFSNTCRQALRGSDVMGRTGGEEFAILFTETPGPEAFEVAERLREAIAATSIPLERGLPIHVTASLGIASFLDSDVNIDVFLSRADGALYEAKRNGRNRTCAAIATKQAGEEPVLR